MKRSEIIALARALIVQGDIDPLWSDTEWDVIFNEAVDLVHEGLIDAESGYFLTRNHTLTLADGKYPLPDDWHSMMYVEDDSGEIQDATEEDEGEMSGYLTVDGYLELVDFGDDPPATLICHYKRWPKEIPDWDGTADPADNAAYVPDRPLHNRRGGRLLARIMQTIAQGKDETLAQTTMAHITGLLNRFVDVLELRSSNN